MVRAKFKVDQVSKNEEGAGSVTLRPVYGGSPENDEFFRMTPGGQITLATINPVALGQFTEGKEYFVDFTPAESPA